MDGYKIVYRTADGAREITWFGKPEGSFDLSQMSKYEEKGIILMMFSQAHSGCDVISLEPCTVEQFQSM